MSQSVDQAAPSLKSKLLEASAVPIAHLPGVQTVVFDLDDTLQSERDYAFSGFAAVADWLGRQIVCPIDALARMRELFETEHRHHVFNRLLAELRYSDPDRLVPAMIECYRNHIPEVRLLPDAERALTRWHDRFLALISDGPLGMQQRKVDALKLSNRLNLIVLTDEWGREFWKPHARAFEFLQQCSGHQSTACVYIADNPAKDFVAPRRLGWRTIQVLRPGGVYVDTAPATDGRPEFQVRSLDEIDMV